MNARLEPKIVAARTQRAVAREHGAGSVARRIASSHGPLARTLTTALGLRLGEIRRGNRIRRTLRVPDHGRDPPSFAVVDELDRVDPALERLRVGTGAARLVRRENVADVSEAVGAPRDLALEEAGERLAL